MSAKKIQRVLFCFGLGYCAQSLISYLLKRDEDWTIHTTYRSVATKNQVDSSIIMHDFDTLKALPEGVTHILISIPPRGNTDIVLHRFADDICSKNTKLKWVAYLSSTGVYGDHKGNWVNEDSETDDSFAFSRPRLMAERAWLNLFRNHGTPVHIFRLAGIYGPGRSEVEKALAKQSRIIQKENHFFSRIHVDDIAQSLYASMRNTTPGSIYNLADDFPCPHAEIVYYTHQLLMLQPPHEEDYSIAEMSDMLRYFYSKSAKASNRKMKEVLGVQLLYPSYREGLKAIVNSIGEFKYKP